MTLKHSRLFSLFYALSFAKCLVLPNNCKSGQYYDSGSLTCRHCPANASMVTSGDGFGCACEEHSIPSGVAQCKPCNATEAVSSDGTMCIPRRCQNSPGKVVCRKCPNNYISVTQNLDGSPLKEVQCIKCFRGYKPQENVCVKCEACMCNKNQIIVHDTCIPKSYLNTRPKPEDKELNPLKMLTIIKHEYLCTQNSSRSCRILADECVKNFYKVDPAGPCRLWTQSKLNISKDLPRLTLDNDERMRGIELKIYGKKTLIFVTAIFTFNGGFKLLRDSDKRLNHCQLPGMLKIGQDITYHCNLNVTALSKTDLNGTLATFININGEYKPLPIILRKPNGYKAEFQKEWSSDKFRRYFLLHTFISNTTNSSYSVYLSTLLIRLRLERNKQERGSLKLSIDVEAKYSIKSSISDIVSTSLKIENALPSANIIKGLEIWGGILGALTLLYALVQWRSVVHRGGSYISILPLISGATADTLYFAAWFTTLHALAAEAGTLGMTLPLSNKEEYIIKAFVFSSFAFKSIKTLWVNWKQCQSDVFLIDWTEYNSSWKEESTNVKRDIWRAKTLLREWSKMQTKRRVSPGFTVTLTLLVFHIMSPWFLDIPPSLPYKWAIATIAWWVAYTVVLLARLVLERVVGSPSALLPKICQGVGISLLVFEDEYYAHYVHGRNDELKDIQSIIGTLTTCRVFCAPQFRGVCKQLSIGSNTIYNESKEDLISKFLIAFFERSLEGINWVASERTFFERLLDIELSSRESGFISTLLYDNDSTPSCFIMTWWGQEWSLITFDALLLSLVVLINGDILLAALITLVIWQIMLAARNWFGNRNVTRKTNIQFD